VLWHLPFIFLPESICFVNFWRIHSIAWKRNVKAETRNNFIWGKIHFMALKSTKL
jgi:hypothetical protein